jgi:Domain of unknown function (DUF4352)
MIAGLTSRTSEGIPAANVEKSATSTKAPTNTPLPTPTPVPLSFEEIVTTYDGLTGIQRVEYLKEILGRRAKWIGTISEVSPDGTVSVEMGKDFFTSLSYRIYLQHVPRDIAIALRKGQAIQFEAVISNAYDSLGVAIYLDFVSLSQSIDTPRTPQASLATPTTMPSPKATAVTRANDVGVRIVSNGIALTAMKVWKTRTAGYDADPGNTWLVVDVLEENISHDGSPYNVLYFQLLDKDGYSYDPTIYPPSPTFPSGIFNAGSKVRGNVAFQVPLTAKGFVLNYKPIVLFAYYDTISINLDQ